MSATRIAVLALLLMMTILMCESGATALLTGEEGNFKLQIALHMSEEFGHCRSHSGVAELHRQY